MRNENSFPINKTAALVMSKGEHYDYKNTGVNAENENYISFNAPDQKQLLNPSFVDFTGYKKGRLTILGLSESRGRWVCKCSCGIYLIRASKAIKNKENKDDCCVICRNTKYLIKSEKFRRTGVEAE